MIAIPAGAFDEIPEVEIKLALEAIVGHRRFRQFGMVPFQLWVIFMIYIVLQFIS